MSVFTVPKNSAVVPTKVILLSFCDSTYIWYGGPAVPCRGDTQANATLGTTAVRETVDRTTTSWEIRAPGNEFGQPNDVFVEAHTSDPTELARAMDLVKSFRWLDPSYNGGCPGPVLS